MGWESFGVVRFHLRPLLPGQTNIAKLKVLITRVLLVLEVWDGKPTYRKSWAGISVRNSPWPCGQGPPLFKLGPPQLDFHGPQWATTLTTTCLMW